MRDKGLLARMKRESNQARWKTQRGAIATAFLSQRPPEDDDEDTRCWSSSSSSCSQRNRSGNPPRDAEAAAPIPNPAAIRQRRESASWYLPCGVILSRFLVATQRTSSARSPRAVSASPTRPVEPVCAYERDYDLLAITSHPYVQNWDHSRLNQYIGSVGLCRPERLRYTGHHRSSVQIPGWEGCSVGQIPVVLVPIYDVE